MKETTKGVNKLRERPSERTGDASGRFMDAGKVV